MKIKREWSNIGLLWALVLGGLYMTFNVLNTLGDMSAVAQLDQTQSYVFSSIDDFKTHATFALWVNGLGALACFVTAIVMELINLRQDRASDRYDREVAEWRARTDGAA